MFERYPDAAAYADADPAELEQRIRPTGFFRNKTKSIIGLGNALVDHHDSQVPDEMGQLVDLLPTQSQRSRCRFAHERSLARSDHNPVLSQGSGLQSDRERRGCARSHLDAISLLQHEIGMANLQAVNADRNTRNLERAIS